MCHHLFPPICPTPGFDAREWDNFTLVLFSTEEIECDGCEPELVRLPDVFLSGFKLGPAENCTQLECSGAAFCQYRRGCLSEAVSIAVGT